MLNEALAAADAIALRLRRSHIALASVFPLHADSVEALDETAQERVDAFLKRFEQLQDSVSNTLGRVILAAVGDDVRSFSARAAFDRLGSLGALHDPDQFFAITRLRHRLAHEYPGLSPEKQAARLNEAWSMTPHLLAAFEDMKSFAARLSP